MSSQIHVLRGLRNETENAIVSDRNLEEEDEQTNVRDIKRFVPEIKYLIISFPEQIVFISGTIFLYRNTLHRVTGGIERVKLMVKANARDNPLPAQSAS